MRLSLPLALIAFALVPAEAQTSPALKDLTVPAGSLPAGCRLKPLDQRGGIIPMTTNPWITTEKRFIGFLSGFVDPEKKMATIPKELLKDSAAMDRYLETLKDPVVMERFLKAQSDGIGTGYVAIYREPGAEEIGVYALEFSTPISESQRERLLKHDVVILGSMAVRLWVDGDSRKCFEAVKRHVLAVKARSYSVESPSK